MDIGDIKGCMVSWGLLMPYFVGFDLCAVIPGGLYELIWKSVSYWILSYTRWPVRAYLKVGVIPDSQLYTLACTSLSGSRCHTGFSVIHAGMYKLIWKSVSYRIFIVVKSNRYCALLFLLNLSLLWPFPFIQEAVKVVN